MRLALTIFFASALLARAFIFGNVASGTVQNAVHAANVDNVQGTNVFLSGIFAGDAASLSNLAAAKITGQITTSNLPANVSLVPAGAVIVTNGASAAGQVPTTTDAAGNWHWTNAPAGGGGTNGINGTNGLNGTNGATGPQGPAGAIWTNAFSGFITTNFVATNFSGYFLFTNNGTVFALAATTNYPAVAGGGGGGSVLKQDQSGTQTDQKYVGISSANQFRCYAINTTASYTLTSLKVLLKGGGGSGTVTAYLYDSSRSLIATSTNTINAATDLLTGSFTQQTFSFSPFLLSASTTYYIGLGYPADGGGVIWGAVSLGGSPNNIYASVDNSSWGFDASLDLWFQTYGY